MAGQPAEDALTVLVVDDHPLVRMAFTEVLRRAGYRVVEAESGEQAIALARSSPPGLVIMDVWMPGMSGIEATTRLRAEHPALPILMVTADSGADTARAALAAGATSFVTKAGTPEVLLDAVRRTTRAQSVLAPAEVVEALVRPAGSPVERLTEREREVLAAVAGGSTAAGAAARLGLSPRTVENHLARIRAKLGLSNLAQLLRVAIEHGLDRPPDHQRRYD